MSDYRIFVTIAVAALSFIHQRSLIEIDPAPISISAEMFQAVQKSMTDMEGWTRLPKRMRNPSNYDIRIKEVHPDFIIDLLPRKAKGEGLTSGGKTRLGYQIRYTIAHNTFRVKARRLFE